MDRTQMTNEQLCELAKQGDFEARQALIENNLPFIRKTAYEIWNSQRDLNRALGIEAEDLTNVAVIGILERYRKYDPQRGNLFLTFAARVIRNRILSCIKKHRKNYKDVNPCEVISLDAAAEDEVRFNRNFTVDPILQTPEQIYLAKEKIVDIHAALDNIEKRESEYLKYRFGFDADAERTQTETAGHFTLSLSRAKSIEKNALDNVWLELPWWFR